MINSKMICKIMGSLFFIEAGFLILCALLAIYYKETDLTAFLSSAAITAGAGIAFSIFGKNAERKISRRDGYVVVSLAWIFFSLFGMLPFYLSGYIPSITDAFLKPCRDSPLPEQAFWIISNHCPTDYFSGEA